MRRRVLIVSASIAALLAISAAAGSQPGRVSRFPGGTLVKANAHQALPRHGGTVTSLNWSGYAVTPARGGVTAVAATFVVPRAGLVPPGFAATWAGIGGYSTPDLIQAGVGEQSLPTLPVLGPQYFAWYELLPNAETPITGCSGDATCRVVPGDRVTVQISQVRGTTWRVAMADAGRWSWSHNLQYASSRTSAEWILEAPSLVTQTLLAPVGTVRFGPGSTFTARGVTRTIAAGNPTQIILTPGLINEATPSGLSPDGRSFNDCSYAPTCPRP